MADEQPDGNGAHTSDEELRERVRGLDEAIARCVTESRDMTQRKDALLVELGVISDSLEQLHLCRTQLEELREDAIEEMDERRTNGARKLDQQQIEQPKATEPTSQPAPMLAAPSAPAPAQEPAQPPASVPHEDVSADEARRRAYHGGRASAEFKALRRAAALPADEQEREALVRRQVVVRGMPPGALDEVQLAGLLEGAMDELPAFDRSAGDACTLVQMYAGGTYAFVAMRHAGLAATAAALPPLRCAGVTLTITRVRGCEGLDEADALPVPPELDLTSLGSSASAGGSAGASAVPSSSTALNLESKLFWKLRSHPTNPKPCEKEVKESFAFFKKSEKLLGRRRLIIDCCGSHGLVGAIFTAYGRCARSVVLDLHQPGSFEQLCAAWAPWLTLPEKAPCEECGGDGDGDGGGEVGGRLGIEFVTGDFNESLPALLDGCGLAASEIAVVACHACTHLTDRIVSMCIARGIDFAVMPCCQRDLQTNGQMAIVAKSLKIGEHAAIDVARLGGIVARGYDCRWRTIDAAITPENRLLVGLAKLKPSVALQRKLVEDRSSAKITQIYSRIHRGAGEHEARVTVE